LAPLVVDVKALTTALNDAPSESALFFHSVP
jgi:hypothetical protein